MSDTVNFRYSNTQFPVEGGRVSSVSNLTDNISFF